MSDRSAGDQLDATGVAARSRPGGKDHGIGGLRRPARSGCSPRPRPGKASPALAARRTTSVSGNARRARILMLPAYPRCHEARDRIATPRRKRSPPLTTRGAPTPSTWSRIERGLMSADNRFTLAEIAAALECPTTDLTGIPTPVNDKSLITAQGNVYAIREALQPSPPAVADHDRPRPPSPPGLQTAATTPTPPHPHCTTNTAGVSGCRYSRGATGRPRRSPSAKRRSSRRTAASRPASTPSVRMYRRNGGRWRFGVRRLGGEATMGR